MKKILLVLGLLTSVSAFADHGNSITITCQSVNFNTSYCDTGVYIDDVYLESQLSHSACIEGNTWGHDERSIWVSGGCRAVFRVFGYASGPYQTVNINCASVNFNYAVCNTGLRNIIRANLLTQFSHKPCIQGSTWGINGNSVWVNNGCRGLFAVTGFRY